MELYQLTEKIWYTSYEEERDRPALGYIKGEKYSIAIDAGHSDDHLKEFYQLLRQHDLPLPSLTVITHWHWDHSFAMHAVNGLTLASEKTAGHLQQFIDQRSEENDLRFRNMDSCIAAEYPVEKPIIVVNADMVFRKNMHLDCGNTPAEIFELVSPHSDDATFIYLPEEKVIFLGDAISGVYPTWNADEKKLAQLRNQLSEIDADWFVGAHWKPWKKQQLLDELQEKLLEYGTETAIE